MGDPGVEKCRLCGSDSHWVFRKELLGRLDVSYFECVRCGSLETGTPDWLDEAYQEHALSGLDTGAADRNLLNFALVTAVAKLLRITGPILDFGGGDGLLCRLLRDIGFDCWVSDKHSQPSYAQGFSCTPGEGFELVTAFEVFEHFADPAAETADLFSIGARAVLVSTELYRQQGADWWYLSPETGQHVFFYSERAMRLIAQNANYNLILAKHFVLFHRDPTVAWRRRAITLLRHPVLRAIQCGLPLLSHSGISRDFDDCRRLLSHHSFTSRLRGPTSQPPRDPAAGCRRARFRPRL
jgi:hypothetical protein